MRFLEILSFFFFSNFLATCGILVPQPGIKPMPPEVGVWSLNHWTTREVPRNFTFTLGITYINSSEYIELQISIAVCCVHYLNIWKGSNCI